MRSLFAVLILLVAVQAFAYDANETIWNSPDGSYLAPVPGPVYSWERVTLYNNGPVWNAVYGTYLESILQSVTLGMSTYGFGHAISGGYRMADDFVVPAGETWDIQSITFFAYQTGSTTNPSTFTNYVVQIWNGVPGVGTVIWGDLTTNRLTGSVWSGVQRTLENTHATNRPIFANTCSVPVQLTAGQYWLDWQCSGTLTSGPWAPPIAILGQAVTGDAYQYSPTTLTWGPANDGGTGLPRQGMPFIIEGAIPTPVEAATWGGIKALYR
jgi:hypothetical protein